MKSKIYFFLLTIALLGQAWSQPIWQALHHSIAQQPTIRCQVWNHELRIQILWSGFYRYYDASIQSYTISTPKTQTSDSCLPKLPVGVYFIAVPNQEQGLPQITIEEQQKTVFDGFTMANIKDSESRCQYSLIDANWPDPSPTWFSSAPTSDQADWNVEHSYQNCPLISMYPVKKMMDSILVCLVIHPFTYYPANQQLIVHDFLQVRFTLKRTAWSEVGLQYSGLAKLWANEILNPILATQDDDIPEEYLVITADSFKFSLEPLLEHRRREGFLVTVKTVSEVKEILNYTGLLSAAKLREFLVLYYNQQPCLTYVLLVGDVEFIPVKYQDDDGTDFFYSTLDDTGDLFPDVYLGRLPVNSPDEVTEVIKKILAYEQALPSKKVLLASYLQDDNFDGVSDRDYIALSEKFRAYLNKQQYECIRSYTKTPGSFPLYYRDNTPIPSDITFDSNVNDVIRAINSGVALVNHRDHGTHTGWDHPSFQDTDLHLLSNRRYPLMFNIDCATGQFDLETQAERRETEGSLLQSDHESFSEQLLVLKQAGMASIIAPTRVTNNGVNDVFNRGLMGAVWPKMFDVSDAPATRLGQVLYRGRIQVLREIGNTNGSNDKVLENFRQYHILGDPALRICQPQ